MFGLWRSSGPTAAKDSAIIQHEALSLPFSTDSPFLFAVYHLDRFPRGNSRLGPDCSLDGRNLRADFGNKDWNMYHGGEGGVPGFPAHPHRGFETITVTRQGFVDHADSLGNEGRFGNGDVQWMSAARGVRHAEMFPLLDQERENVLELFQIWINLPRRSKMLEPDYRMLWSEELPRGAPAGGQVDVTLVAGELPGMPAPPPPPTHSYASDPASDVLVATAKIGPGCGWTLPRYSGSRSTEGLSRNVYFFAGHSATIDGVAFTTHRRVRVRPDADLEIAAGSGGPIDVLVLQGRDLVEPVRQEGPFVMSTRDELRQAFADYQQTGFGKWKWRSEAVVHPRERPRFMQYADGTMEERPR